MVVASPQLGQYVMLVVVVGGAMVSDLSVGAVGGEAIVTTMVDDMAGVCVYVCVCSVRRVQLVGGSAGAASLGMCVLSLSPSCGTAG